MRFIPEAFQCEQRALGISPVCVCKFMGESLVASDEEKELPVRDFCVL